MRLVVTFGIAIASFRLVERPIRQGALRNGWAALATPLAVGLTTALLLFATVSPPSGGQLAAPARPAVPDDVHVVVLGDSVALTLFGGNVPKGMSIDDAARLGCGVLTGWNGEGESPRIPALRRTRFESGEPRWTARTPMLWRS